MSDSAISIVTRRIAELERENALGAELWVDAELFERLHKEMRKQAGQYLTDRSYPRVWAESVEPMMLVRGVRIRRRPDVDSGPPRT